MANPQQILAKNKSLLIVYVLAIAPIPLWFVLVGGGVKNGRTQPKGKAAPDPGWNPASFLLAKSALGSVQRDIDDLHKKIKSGDPVYTKKHIEIFKKRNEEASAQLEKMATVFKDRDEQLERWFEKFKDTPAGKEPSQGDFDVAFKSAVEDLGRENPKITAFDPGTKKSFLFAEGPPNAPGQMRVWQKKYWMQNEIVQALKAVPDARLGSAIVFSPPSAPPPPPPGQPAAKRPYELLPVSFGAVLSFRDVPKLVRELMARQIVFRLVKLDVELMEFQYDRSRDFPSGPPTLRVNESGPKKYFDQFAYPVHFHNANDAPTTDAAEEKLIPEPPIKVEIALEAFDFDMDVIAPKPAEEKKEEGK